MGVEESYQEQFAVQAIISFRLKMNLIEPAERLLLLHQEATKAKTNKKEKTAGLLPASDGSGEKGELCHEGGNPNASCKLPSQC